MIVKSMTLTRVLIGVTVKLTGVLIRLTEMPFEANGNVFRLKIVTRSF